MFLDGIIGFAFRNLDVSRVDTRLFCIEFIQDQIYFPAVEVEVKTN